MLDPVWIDGVIWMKPRGGLEVTHNVSVEVSRDVATRALGMKKDRPQDAQDSVCIAARASLAKNGTKIRQKVYYQPDPRLRLEDRYYFIPERARDRNGKFGNYHRGYLLLVPSGKQKPQVNVESTTEPTALEKFDAEVQEYYEQIVDAYPPETLFDSEEFTSEDLPPQVRSELENPCGCVPHPLAGK